MKIPLENLRAGTTSVNFVGAGGRVTATPTGGATTARARFTIQIISSASG